MIALLDLSLIIVGIVVLLFLVTQVIMPMIFGTPFFPIFGTLLKRDIEAAGWELENVAEAERLKAMQDEINARKAKLKEEK